MGKLKKWYKDFWQWCKREILTKDMLIYLLIAELIFWSPVIVCGVLALTVNAWYWTAVSGIILFWAGPFTPAVTIQFGLAYFLKRIFKGKKNEHKHEH